MMANAQPLDINREFLMLLTSDFWENADLLKYSVMAKGTF